jgi:hypothetical protein
MCARAPPKKKLWGVKKEMEIKNEKNIKKCAKIKKSQILFKLKFIKLNQKMGNKDKFKKIKQYFPC